MAPDPNQGTGEEAAAALDLGTVPPRGTDPPATHAATKAYNPAQDREKKRGQIATWLVALLIGVAAAPFLLILVRGVCVAADANTASLAASTCAGLPAVDLIEVLQLVLTPVVALVGAATGFYFGEKSGSDGR